MQGDPATDPYSKGRDLRLVGSFANPDADSAWGTMSIDAQFFERRDDPAFERVHQPANIAPALVEIEHQVDDSLPRPVIGVTAAATGFIHRQIKRVEELGGIGARAGCEERWVLEQPDAFRRLALSNGARAFFHEGERLFVGHLLLADSPLHIQPVVHCRQMEPASAVGKIASAGYRPHKRTNCRNREGFMRRLSISLAWEQTKSCLAADGRLLATVAAALVSLPIAVVDVIGPNGFTKDNLQSPEFIVLGIAVLILLLTGQLSIIRLAIRPSVSVGDAILHGVRRLPFYVLASMVVGVSLLVLAIVLGMGLFAAGAPANPEQLATSPAFGAAALVFLLVYCFLWVRILAISAPVAGAEPVGPITIIRRSWDLTAGHFWRLLAFLLLFFVGGAIALKAVQLVAALVATIALGPLNSLSPSALVVALIDGIANGVFITILTVMLARVYVQLSGGGSIDVSVPSSGT